MAFVEHLGVSQKETRLSAPCGREILGRSLGSHDAAELVGGICHGNGCRQETTRPHAISCTKTGWSSLTHNRMTRRNLLVEYAMAMIADKKPPVPTPYLAQRRDVALSLTIGCSTRHSPVSLRESKFQFIVEDTWPFQERASGENGRLNLLRMNITTEAGAIFENLRLC